LKNVTSDVRRVKDGLEGRGPKNGNHGRGSVLNWRTTEGVKPFGNRNAGRGTGENPSV